MNCRLVSISGPRKGGEFELRADGSTAGRDPGNAIVLDHLSVSRRHCLIWRNGESWSIRDLDSRNGTIVNQVPVKERELRHGDEVVIGDCVFLFVSQTDARPEMAGVEPQQTRTIVRAEESRYLAAGEMRKELESSSAGRLTEIARNLERLLAASVSLQAAQGVEALTQGVLESALELTPGSRAVMWWSDGGWPEQRFHAGRERGVGAVEAPAPLLRLLEQLVEERAAMISETAGARIATAPVLAFGELRGGVAVECMAGGAPLQPEHLQVLAALAGVAGPLLDHALQMEWLEAENRRLQAASVCEHGMVGESAAMRALYEKIQRVAPADSTVLIRGESGVGKELVARAVHAGSPRAGKPFLAINCATLSETLLESELFGHEKGAFTGAIAQKKGKIEAAAGGSLFLDEVSEMAPVLQAKLLRVLQEREFERVGGTRPIRAEVRFLAASNRDLEDAVERGEFRRDLYYRLNVIPLVLPPLRERREDIPLLASFFLGRFAAKTGRKVRGISAAARTYLLHYDWPGNVRELENAMERAVVLGSGESVMAEDLPETILEAVAAPAELEPARYHEALNRAKRELILTAIAECGGSHAGAAKLLGLHPNYLSRLIRNLRIKAQK
ncbi:MAG: sigma 54-interacting transcriptional regulator [Acidobacteria bacterium]|nr:sigma 54-interacting transcriptional regulator [Acidobacteriota bacterium]